MIGYGRDVSYSINSSNVTSIASGRLMSSIFGTLTSLTDVSYQIWGYLDGCSWRGDRVGRSSQSHVSETVQTHARTWHVPLEITTPATTVSITPALSYSSMLKGIFYKKYTNCVALFAVKLCHSHSEWPVVQNRRSLERMQFLDSYILPLLLTWISELTFATLALFAREVPG